MIQWWIKSWDSPSVRTGRDMGFLKSGHGRFGIVGVQEQTQDGNRGVWGDVAFGYKPARKMLSMRILNAIQKSMSILHLRIVTFAGCRTHSEGRSENLWQHLGPKLYFIYSLSFQPVSNSGVLGGDWDPIFFHSNLCAVSSIYTWDVARDRRWRIQLLSGWVGLKLLDRLEPVSKGYNRPLRDRQYLPWRGAGLY